MSAPKKWSDISSPLPKKQHSIFDLLGQYCFCSCWRCCKSLAKVIPLRLLHPASHPSQVNSLLTPLWVNTGLDTAWGQLLLWYVFWIYKTDHYFGMGNLAWHDRSFWRGCTSETEKDKLDPLVSKFWYCKGFQPLHANNDDSITFNVHSYISYLLWTSTECEAPTQITAKLRMLY